MVLKELLFNIFYIGMVWQSLKNLFVIGVYFGRVWWSCINRFLIVSTLGGCGDLERTDLQLIQQNGLFW